MNEEYTEQVEVQGEFYNVGEQFTLYDTIAVRNSLDTLSKVPQGWYATFALLAGATNHSFFNVRNAASTDKAYCNLDARDQTSFAFRAESISCSFWGSGFYQQISDTYTRLWQPNAFWQATLPFESSLTLRVQQDDKAKLNCLMASPGYGPVSGGWGQQGAATGVTTVAPGIGSLTQGVAHPQARYRFPNVIDIPRRASIAAELSFTAYGRALLTAMPGPGTQPYYTSVPALAQYPAIFGITCALHGRRLVQQRGAYHA